MLLRMNSITNLSPTQLRQAADLQEKILGLQNQLNNLLGDGQVPTPTVTEAPKGPRKRKMSAAGRRAIAETAKGRWAKYNAEKGTPVKVGKRKMTAQGLANIRAGVAKRMAAQGKSAAKPAPKRKFSAAGRAALAAAAKARWAKAKAAGKTRLG
jgi:hypothetical protein